MTKKMIQLICWYVIDDCDADEELRNTNYNFADYFESIKLG